LAAILAACGARTGLDYQQAGSPGPPGGLTDAAADADADANAPVGCQDGTFQLHRAPPAAMFVLDRSESMRQSISTNGNSKWDILITSLEATLPQVDQTMEIGALVFPSSNAAANSCVVPAAPDLEPAFGNVEPLTTLLRNNGPRGSTPTADAIDRAAGSLLGFRAASHARAMVLATDGEPTCNSALDGRTCTCAGGGNCARRPENCIDDVRTAERIAGYRDQGLPTYVIGIQDPSQTNLVGVLNRLALAGGRPQAGPRSYYAASNETELQTALATIRDQVGACTYLTTSVPGDQGTITVEVNGTPIREGIDWSWSNRANGEILFVTNTCVRAGSADLTVTVRCEVPDAGADASIGDASTDR
jgi:hypothetical protein